MRSIGVCKHEATKIALKNSTRGISRDPRSSCPAYAERPTCLTSGRLLSLWRVKTKQVVDFGTAQQEQLVMICDDVLFEEKIMLMGRVRHNPSSQQQVPQIAESRMLITLFTLNQRLALESWGSATSTTLGPQAYSLGGRSNRIAASPCTRRWCSKC